METKRITGLVFLFALVAMVLLPSAARALEVSVLDYQKISDTEGNFPGGLDDNDLFGVAIASAAIGDLDGDGVTDLVVGARGDDDGGENRGAVWILFLNSDGTVKAYQKISNTEGGFTGALNDGDAFGSSVTSLGDLDGDSVTDLAVGARTDDDGATNSGAVWILFLNSDGTVKNHQKISATEGNLIGLPHADNYFGQSVASLGDLDGDEVTDIVVGAFYDNDGGPSTGAVWILFLNTDGTVKAQQKISDTQGNFTGHLDDYDHFGVSVASLGDLDGDGTIDIAVGSFWDDDSGSNHGAVWILFLNADGTVKSYQKISATQGNFTGILNNDDEFGLSVASLNDVDGDGITDIAVGAGGDDDGGTDRGAVWLLFLNTDGTVKAHQKISDTEGGFTGILDNNDNFGFWITSLGDLDGDFIRDIAVGAIGDDDGGENRGAVWILFLDMDLYEVVANKLETAIAEKEDALAGIENALDAEREVMEILDVLGEMYDDEDPEHQDIVRARHDIRQAMVRERIARRLLARSKRDLERALDRLNIEEEPEEPIAPTIELRSRRPRVSYPRF